MTTPDGRRRTWAALDIDFAHSAAGVDLQRRFGPAGLVVWPCLLAESKRSPNEGTWTFTTEAEGWASLGINPPGGVSLQELLRVLAQHHKLVRLRRRGGLTTVTVTDWDRLQQRRKRTPAVPSQSDASPPAVARQSPGSPLSVPSQSDENPRLGAGNVQPMRALTKTMTGTGTKTTPPTPPGGPAVVADPINEGRPEPTAARGLAARYGEAVAQAALSEYRKEQAAGRTISNPDAYLEGIARRIARGDPGQSTVPTAQLDSDELDRVLRMVRREGVTDEARRAIVQAADLGWTPERIAETAGLVDPSYIRDEIARARRPGSPEAGEGVSHV